MRARYYDPATGQFLTRDIAVSKTRQPYEYVVDNPLNGTDPAGLWCFGPTFGGISFFGVRGSSQEWSVGVCSNGDLYANSTAGSYQQNKKGDVIWGLFGGAGTAWQYSPNASCAAQLGGLFHQNYAGLGLGPAVTYSSATGGGVDVETASSPPIPGVGGGLGIGSWDTNTDVHSWNPVQAVKNVWNWLTG